MPSYPRTTTAAIVAALAATVAVGVATITTLTATTGRIATLYASSSVHDVATITTSTITTAAITTANVTTLNAGVSSSTSAIFGQGQAVKGHYSASSTVDPNNIAAYDATTTSFTVTGAKANNPCQLNLPANWVTSSTIQFRCVPTTNTVTLYYRNTSGTAFDLSSDVVGVQTWNLY